MVAAFRADGTADKVVADWDLLERKGKDLSRDVVLEQSSCIQSQCFWTRPIRFDKL